MKITYDGKELASMVQNSREMFTHLDMIEKSIQAVEGLLTQYVSGNLSIVRDEIQRLKKYVDEATENVNALNTVLWGTVL